MVKRKLSTFRLLNRINIRTFLHSKFQFLAVIFITAIALTLYVGLTSNAKSINDRVHSLYQDGNIADIWVTTSTYDENDLNNLKSILDDDGEVESRLYLPASINSYSSNALISESIPNINKPFESDNSEDENFLIVDYRLLETQDNSSSTIVWKDNDGNYLPVPVTFDITTLIDELSSQEIMGYSYLDLFSALTKENKTNIFDNSKVVFNFQVTGEMHFAENVQSSLINRGNFLLGEKYFLNTLYQLIDDTYQVDTDFDSKDPYYELKNLILLAQEFYHIDIIDEIKTQLQSYFMPNQYIIKLNNNGNTEKVVDDIKNYYENKENNNLLIAQTLENQSFNIIIQNDIVQARQLAYIFPIVFFLVAILVVLTTVSQLIIKDQIQIGTLKALGISNRQIILHYMSLATFVILIGVVIGLILGPIILPLIMNQKYAILYSLPTMGYVISIPEAIISTLLIILATVVVTYLVILKTIKLNPANSMRTIIPKSLKAPKKEPSKNPKLIPFKMAFRNIRINIVKSLMVIIGIMGCSALLVCGFGIDDTLTNGINADINNFFNADAYAFYSATENTKEQLLAIDGVDYVEEYTTIPSEITFNDLKYTTSVYCFDDNTTFFDIEKYNIKEDIAISNKVANSLNLSIGDTLMFSSLTKQNEIYYGKVGAIIDVFYMHGIYINIDYNNYSSFADYKSNAWIDINDNYDNNEVINQIISIDNVSSCRSKQESLDIIDNYISSIDLMTLAVKVFAILLAIVVLYNLSLLNYKERARDIATMKVLGFSRFEISSSLLIESLTLTIIGVTLGMFLGFPMEMLVLIVNQTPLVEFLYAVFPLSYFLAIVITLGTSLVVNLFLTLKIKKIKMVESLKSIE